MSGIEFSRQLLRLALAQLLKDAGFDGAGAISLGVLVDVAERYLELVGQRSAELARAAGRTDVSLFDAETALSSLSVSREVLVGYFFEFGLRIPAAARAQQILQQQEEQQQKQRAALLGSGSGNAILDAILGLKKDAGVGESKESQQAAPIEEISGFFRMEPGPFPLDVDTFLDREYDVSQKVPEASSHLLFVDGEGDEEQTGTDLSRAEQHPFSRPRPFSESVYFRGNPDRYRGLGLLSSTQQPPGPRLKRDKAAGKGRRLFEKAYTASLTYKPELESTDRILNVHVSERLFTERLQFSLSLPETSNSGGNMGLLEDFHISSLPDLTGAKRARPVYKDDKREQRREQKALIAAGKLAPEIAGAALQDIPSGASTPVTLPFDPVNVSESGMLMTGFDTQVDLFATAGSQPPLSADSSGFSTGVMAEEIGTNHPFVEEMDFKMEEIEEVEPAPAAPMLDWDDLLDMPMDKTPASSDPTILSQQKALGVSEAPTSVNGTTGHAPLSNTTLTTSAAPSPSTFKLKMKAVLPPAPSTSVPLTSVIDLDPPNEIVETPSPRPLEQTLSASPTSSIHLEATLSQQDQIRCICSEASTDFGSFMISCDECTVWFHGECVGLGPTSIPEGGSWFCFRCKLS